MRETNRVDAAAGDEEAELDELARLIASWVAFSMRMNRGNENLKALAELGLTFPQIGALHVLMFEGAMPVSALTERLDLSLSATSHLVQRLVEANLVKRTEHESDRRQKVVSLTADGKRLLEKMMKARLKEFRSSVEHVQPDLRKELKAVLTKIVDDLAWRTADAHEHGGPHCRVGPDHAGADFAGRDLEGADFAGANLEGADLSGANLKGARLTGANLTGADLAGADLTGARAWQANFANADLSGARLVDADLTGANLKSADLEGTDIEGAKLDDAELPVGFRFRRKVKS